MSKISPFLCTAVVNEFFHDDGKMPELIEALNIAVRALTMTETLEDFFNMLTEMLSQPDEAELRRVLIAFMTSLLVILESENCSVCELIGWLLALIGTDANLEVKTRIDSMKKLLSLFAE